MRWTLRLAGALALLWIVFAASPYVALYRFARAIEAHDTIAVAKRLNARAIRTSLARQIGAVSVDLAAGQHEIGAAPRQFAEDAAAQLVAPFVERLAAASGIIDLLGDGAPALLDDEQAPAPGGLRMRSLSQFWRLYLATETRGFRSVFVTFPPRRPPQERFRLRLRLQGITWRLTDVELPGALRARIARALLRGGAAEPARDILGPAPPAAAPKP